MKGSFVINSTDRNFGFFLELSAWLKQNISHRTTAAVASRYGPYYDEFVGLLHDFMVYSQYNYVFLNKVKKLAYQSGDGWQLWCVDIEYLIYGDKIEYREVYYQVDDDSHAIMLQLAMFGAQP
jgi:hypothetical protein